MLRGTWAWVMAMRTKEEKSETKNYFKAKFLMYGPLIHLGYKDKL